MNHYFLSLTFALRELKSGLSGFKVFIICVALGVASITGVNSINKSIRLAIEEDAQELLGGDLQGRKSYSPINSAEIKDIQKYGRISNQIVMRSMARSSVEKTSQLFQTSLIALKALPVLMLGGFTSIPGAIIGGLMIGLGEKLFEFYIGPMIGGATENWFAYMLALIFLLFRPQGLFGEKIIERV